MTYKLAVSLTNETEGYRFSDYTEDIPEWLLTEDGQPDMGAIFREARSEWGRCASSVHVDTSEGVVRVGWYFVKRDQYADYHSTGSYLRGAWVTIVSDDRSYVSVGPVR